MRTNTLRLIICVYGSSKEEEQKGIYYMENRILEI